jgi:hypothetical protein
MQQSMVSTETGFESAIRAVLVKDYEINRLYSPDNSPVIDFHNVLGSPHYVNPNDPYRPNLGLVDDNIIPVMENSDYINKN